MPSFFNSGIATSARHVVGLHDPPKNTSTFASSAGTLLLPIVVVDEDKL